MRLRKNNNILNCAPEKLPKKGIKFFLFKLFYFLFLSAIILFLIKYFVERYFIYAYATGQVVLRKYHVQLESDCQIIDFMVKDGDAVKIGQPLMKVRFYNSSDAERKYQRAIKLNLDQNKSKIKVLNNHIKQKEKQIIKVLLINSIRKVKDDDYSVVSFKGVDYIGLKKRTDELKLKKELLESECLVIESKNKSEFLRVSYIDDIIKSRFFGVAWSCNQVSEYVKKGEDLLVVGNPDEVMVKASFIQEYRRFLYQGKTITLNFPGGVISNGIIRKVYSSAVRQDSSDFYINKDGVLILVDICPSDKDELAIWKKYIGMKINVKVKRTEK